MSEWQFSTYDPSYFSSKIKPANYESMSYDRKRQWWDNFVSKHPFRRTSPHPLSKTSRKKAFNREFKCQFQPMSISFSKWVSSK